MWLGGNHATVAAVVGFAGGAGAHGEASVYFFDLSSTLSHHRFVFRADMSGTLRAIAARPLYQQPPKEQTLFGIELVTAGDSGEPIRAIHVPRSTSHLRGVHNKFQIAVDCGLAPCDIFSLTFAPDSWASSWSETSEKLLEQKRPIIFAGGRGGRVFAVCHQGIAPIGALVDMSSTESARGKGSRHYWQGRGPIVRLDLLEQHAGLAVATVWGQGAYLLDLGLIPDFQFSTTPEQAFSFPRMRGSVRSSRSGRGGKLGRSGKGKCNESSPRKGTRLRNLKVLRTYPEFTPSRMSVDRHASTIMVISVDGATCRLYAALSGACLYEGPVSTPCGRMVRMAPTPEFQSADQPWLLSTSSSITRLSNEIHGARGSCWWSSVWWSAHEHDGKVCFSRAGFPL